MFSGLKVSDRTKEFNVNELLDKLLVDSNANYQDNLISVSEGVVFVLPSFTQQETTYVVDMSNGFCTCHVGRDGSPHANINKLG